MQRQLTVHNLPLLSKYQHMQIEYLHFTQNVYDFVFLYFLFSRHKFRFSKLNDDACLLSLLSLQVCFVVLILLLLFSFSFFFFSNTILTHTHSLNYNNFRIIELYYTLTISQLYNNTNNIRIKHFILLNKKSVEFEILLRSPRIRDSLFKFTHICYFQKFKERKEEIFLFFLNSLVQKCD